MITALVLATTVHAARVPTGAIQADGRADDAAWATVPAFEAFTQQTPDDGQPATQRTRARIAFDEEALYVLVEAFETDPDGPTALLTRRDRSSSSDWVELYLDTFDDDRTAYKFAVNPLGVVQDARLSDGGESEDADWDAVWTAETHRGREGWTAELRIPFSQLRYDPSRTQWGLGVARTRVKNNEFDTFPRVRSGTNRFLDQLATLAGLDRLPSPWRLELAPYVTMSVTRTEDDHVFDARTGGDARIGLGSALTLDVTANPDFGQVEADPSNLNLSAFETFFEEKRPFFLQGRDIFAFGLGYGDGNAETLFYSRRIGRAPSGDPGDDVDEVLDVPSQTTILGAAKLTGKTPGGWSVGVLDALTQEEVAAVSVDGRRRERVVEPRANAFVARVSKDLQGGQTQLGVMATHLVRDLDDTTAPQFAEQAGTGGVDLDHGFGDDWRLQFAAYGSHVRGSAEAIEALQTSSVHGFQRPDADHLHLDPDAESLSGWGGKVVGGKLDGRDWRGAAGVIVRSPGFDPNELGYLRHADEQNAFAWGQYRLDDPGPWRHKANVNFNAWAGKSFGPELTTLGGNVNGFWSFPSYAYVYAGGGTEREALDVGVLRGGPALRTPSVWFGWIGCGTDDREKWVLSASLDGHTVADGAGDGWEISVDATFRPRPSLSLTLSPSWEQSTSGHQFVETRASAGGGPDESVVGRLDRQTASLTARADWTLATDFTLQLYVMPYLSAGEYRDYRVVVDPQATRYDDRFAPTTYDGSDVFLFEQLRTNLVLRWAFRPGSAAYLVWSREQSQDRDDRGRLSPVSDTAELVGGASTDTVLLKVTYWTD